MKLIRKSEAMKLLASNNQYVKFKYDRGKYVKTPTELIESGVELMDLDGVFAVYSERRKDKHGLYTQLMTVGIR